MRALKSCQHGKYTVGLSEDIDNEKLFVTILYKDNLIETFDFLFHNLLEAENFFFKMSGLFEKLNNEVEFQKIFD